MGREGEGEIDRENRTPMRNTRMHACTGHNFIMTVAVVLVNGSVAMHHAR